MTNDKSKCQNMSKHVQWNAALHTLRSQAFSEDARSAASSLWASCKFQSIFQRLKMFIVFDPKYFGRLQFQRRQNNSHLAEKAYWQPSLANPIPLTSSLSWSGFVVAGSTWKCISRIWLPSFYPFTHNLCHFLHPLVRVPAHALHCAALLVDCGGLLLSGALGTKICTEYKRVMSHLMCKESNRSQISCVPLCSTHIHPLITAASIQFRIWVKNSSLSRLSSCCACFLRATSDCQASFLPAIPLELSGTVSPDDKWQVKMSKHVKTCPMKPHSTPFAPKPFQRMPVLQQALFGPPASFRVSFSD